LKDIIENYKNFNKKIKENNKKSKEKGPNWNNYHYHWKQNINLIWRIKIKAIKTFLKRKMSKNTKLK
jgi:hypothetical protein